MRQIRPLKENIFPAQSAQEKIPPSQKYDGFPQGGLDVPPPRGRIGEICRKGRTPTRNKRASNLAFKATILDNA